jgi:hypothetical protein
MVEILYQSISTIHIDRQRPGSLVEMNVTKHYEHLGSPYRRKINELERSMIMRTIEGLRVILCHKQRIFLDM